VSAPAGDDDAAARHALNNMLGKIVGGAELALDQVRVASVREELESIIRLALETGRIVARLGPARPAPWSD
jgi:hypothetical protein